VTDDPLDNVGVTLEMAPSGARPRFCAHDAENQPRSRDCLARS
jgi:hypothetical protein